jgi:hypothetical protein
MNLLRMREDMFGKSKGVFGYLYSAPEAGGEVESGIPPGCCRCDTATFEQKRPRREKSAGVGRPGAAEAQPQARLRYPRRKDGWLSPDFRRHAGLFSTFHATRY